MVTPKFMVIVLVSLVGFAATELPVVAQQPPPSQQPAAAAMTDLDAFMAKVLERRNENWRTLHDYILSERESFELTGPADLPLHGMSRDYQWSVREGYLVRTPVKANGVTLGADERARYENEWLAQEKRRETSPESPDAPRKVELSMSATGNVEFSGFAGPGAEPRFISEAYFMRFRFEPGNYYFAGREQLDGRNVLKIEYLPSQMFNDDESDSGKNRTKQRAAPAAAPQTPPPASKPDKRRDDGEDERINRAMNKTSTVTMWIDPTAYQIVKFQFENVDFGFLPGRHLARVDGAHASMTMGLVFDGIWLPKDITMEGRITLASGSVGFRYRRAFSDYRRGEVRARIRGYAEKEPQS